MLVDAALAGAGSGFGHFDDIFGSSWDCALWIATGAGSVARQIIGTTVIGGMLAAGDCIFLVRHLLFG